MRFLLSSIAFVALSVSPASAEEEPSEFEVAGMQVALAANCRATYGEDELFEIAFANMEELVRKKHPDVSKRDMRDAKEKLYNIETDKEDNMFLRLFCTKLKEHLMP